MTAHVRCLRCLVGHLQGTGATTLRSRSTIPAAVGGSGAGGSRREVQRSAAELAVQAEEFQRMILEDAMDEQGIVRHHLRATRDPLTDDVRSETHLTSIPHAHRPLRRCQMLPRCYPCLQLDHTLLHLEINETRGSPAPAPRRIF